MSKYTLDFEEISVPWNADTEFNSPNIHKSAEMF